MMKQVKTEEGNFLAKKSISDPVEANRSTKLR
ncbi:hypothetical protein Q667_09930 [Marinobacter sp. C1S70]|nr:hypothetical protein Q667_09930 [Marinobacter sp. C1S70]